MDHDNNTMITLHFEMCIPGYSCTGLGGSMYLNIRIRIPCTYYTNIAIELLENSSHSHHEHENTTHTPRAREHHTHHELFVRRAGGQESKELFVRRAGRGKKLMNCAEGGGARNQRIICVEGGGG